MTDSEQTRRAYRSDVRDFLESLDIRDGAELYAVTPEAVIAWRSKLQRAKSDGGCGLARATVRRKLSALSSLFTHLVEQNLVDFNPVTQVKRPKRPKKRGKSVKGKTPALPPDEVRAILDAPWLTTTCMDEDGSAKDLPIRGRMLVRHLRDRALLSLGFQCGLRRSEIARLRVGDIFYKEKLPTIRFQEKGGDENELPLNPQTHRRIEAYIRQAGHGENDEAPLLLPQRGNQYVAEHHTERHLEPDMVDKVVRKWAAKALGQEAARKRKVSAHTMRSSFITRALDNGCRLEKAQESAGHAHVSTTLLYDHRGDHPEEAATFFATY